MPYPAYVQAFQTGRLREKLKEAEAKLSFCQFCPRKCRVNRLLDERGTCKTGRLARVASYSPHFGEEKVLTGEHGSGTIFFSGCNLKCRFCQNWDISHETENSQVTPEQIAEMALRLQSQKCHNINLVTPTHVVPQIIEAVHIAAGRGLHLPLVYNTSSYESVETLRLLDGIVDIYLPDFKFWDPELSKNYLTTSDYPEKARAAITEMHRQVGNLEIDAKTGLARRGVLIRHLVMPASLEDSRKIFHWITERISIDSTINIMDQYAPAGEILNDKTELRLSRHLMINEYREAVRLARDAGLRRLAD